MYGSVKEKTTFKMIEGKKEVFMKLHAFAENIT